MWSCISRFYRWKKGMKTQRDDTSVRSFYFNTNAFIPVAIEIYAISHCWEEVFILFDSILDGSCLKFSS